MRSALPILCIFSALFLPVSSVAQSSASEGDVIISEIMPDPDAVSDADGEYIELFNTTGQSISIDGWAISDAGGSPSSISQVTIPAGGFVVLCRNATTSENGGIDCADSFSSAVNNGTETITLQDGNGDTVNQITYDLNSGNWPDPTGASLEYTGAPGDDNSMESHWQKATTRTGDFAGDGGDFGSPNANAEGGQLPVDLARFSIRGQGHRALLRWRTVTETDNAGFTVQHKGPQDKHWNPRGFVEGAGTTAEVHDYHFRTKSLGAGLHVFRLKQVDTDGTAHYSERQSIRIRAEKRLTFSGPNPLADGQSATVTVRAKDAQRITIAVFNALGQRVQTVASTSVSANETVRTRVSTELLGSGVYFLRAIGPSIHEVRQFTIVQ